MNDDFEERLARTFRAVTVMTLAFLGVEATPLSVETTHPAGRAPAYASCLAPHGDAPRFNGEPFPEAGRVFPELVMATVRLEPKQFVGSFGLSERTEYEALLGARANYTTEEFFGIQVFKPNGRRLLDIQFAPVGDGARMTAHSSSSSPTR